MYTVVEVPEDAPNLLEQLGTKEKFWFEDEGGRRTLFKRVRQETGEDWSEKVASELALRLGLPTATYDFATWKGSRGVITPGFVPDGGRLVHGNELLGRLDPSYPGKKLFRVREHRLRLVLAIVRSEIISAPLGWSPPDGVSAALHAFVGYLLLDAWIGNTDRHHENWGLVVSPSMTIHLAPSYDHASSLGRNEPDESRVARLTTRDPGYSVAHYAARATSAFYGADGKSLSTLDAFADALRAHPVAGSIWLDRMATVTPSEIQTIFGWIPASLISQPAVQFAQAMLTANRRRLRELRAAL